MPLSHLQHQCGNSQQIHGMGQRRFMHRGSGIHPDHVGIGHFRIGKQCLRKIFTESYLWDLTHKNITGVQIDTNIGSDQGIHTVAVIRSIISPDASPGNIRFISISSLGTVRLAMSIPSGFNAG